MIGEILDTTPLTGKEATKDDVLKRIGSVALVHIAAHGKMGSGEIFLAPNRERKYSDPEDKDYIMKIAVANVEPPSILFHKLHMSQCY